jgi:anti-sigma B factor antagonist
MFWIRVRTDAHDDCAVVELHGELDVATALTVRGLLITVTAREQVTIVDLAGLAFMDCTGMGALIRARKHALRAGHALHLAAPAEPVRQVLELSGAARLFSIHASVEAAAAAATGRSRKAPAADQVRAPRSGLARRCPATGLPADGIWRSMTGHAAGRLRRLPPFSRRCARAFALRGTACRQRASRYPAR